MNSEKKRLSKRLGLSLALAAMLAVPGGAWAADIVIDQAVSGHAVYGNGDPDNEGNPNPGPLTAPNDNSVVINSGGTVNDSVIGGLGGGNSVTTPASATGNKVTLNGTAALTTGTGPGTAIGGQAESDGGGATASGNSVVLNLTTGSVAVGVTGGYAKDNGAGAATAAGNSVTINGGTVGIMAAGGHAETQSGAATASGNLVRMNGGRVAGYNAGNPGILAGGLAQSDTGAASATGNTLEFSGGEAGTNNVAFGVLAGGLAQSSFGDAFSTGNKVYFTGGTLTAAVSGEPSMLLGGSAAIAGAGRWGEASDNLLVIGGGTVKGNIFGGGVIATTGAAGRAINNTVILTGAPTLTDSSLYGGLVSSAQYPLNPVAGMEAFAGNALNVWHYGGSPINNAANFERYDFVFPVDQTGAVLTVAGTLTFGDGGTRRSYVTASTLGGAAPLKTGDSVQLIDGTTNGGATGTIPDPAMVAPRAYGSQHGAVLLYDVALTQTTDNKDLFANITGVSADPRAKSLSESRVGGLAFLTQGADLVAGPGLAAADRAAFYSKEAGEFGLAAFAALSGGSNRYDTGSHVDVRGVSLMAGLAAGSRLEPGRLAFAGFFEYGNGSYDAYNDSVTGELRGDGDLSYMGGGLAGRFESASLGSGRFHVEASGRGGRVKNDYQSPLKDAIGRQANYEDSASYFGLHLGGGYLIDIGEQSAADVYGQYFWTRQGGTDATLTTQDPISFGAANSSRLRLGARFSHAFNENVTPYAGLAWEHEFSGEAKASAYGYGLDAASLKGSSGLGELGLALRPAADSPFSVDLGVNGYVGTKRGVQGTLQMKFEF